MERGVIRQGSKARVSIFNVAEDGFRECSYEAILRKLHRHTGNRKFDVRPAPAIADRLVSFARFGALPTRYPYGQMFFATDKLENEGYRPRFGLEQLYRQAISRISEMRN
jgi:hypothetical protein